MTHVRGVHCGYAVIEYLQRCSFSGIFYQNVLLSVEISAKVQDVEYASVSLWRSFLEREDAAVAAAEALATFRPAPIFPPISWIIVFGIGVHYDDAQLASSAFEAPAQWSARGRCRRHRKIGRFASPVATMRMMNNSFWRCL